MRHIKTNCPECKSGDILMDTHRAETFCNHCGLILIDNTLPRVTEQIEESKLKDKFIRSLWRKKIK